MHARRTTFGTGQRLVAPLLPAAALLPAGPVLGLDVVEPFDLGVRGSERGRLEGRGATGTPYLCRACPPFSTPARGGGRRKVSLR